VPAFKRKPGGHEIPDTQADWKKHHEMTSAKNEACGGDNWVPFIKMVKGANRELGDAVEPSFLLRGPARRNGDRARGLRRLQRRNGGDATDPLDAPHREKQRIAEAWATKS
jgi:hypothetical protein